MNSKYLIGDEMLAKLSNDELLKRMADNLVEMHEQGGIELGYWNVGLEVVKRFYEVNIDVTVRTGKRV